MRAAVLLFALAPLLAGQSRDPCRGLPDAQARTDCLEDREEASGPTAWGLGEETDPITDRRSVVLRRLADAPFRGPAGRALQPALTLVCYQGREVLLSLEAGEPLATAGGDGPHEIHLTVRIGTDPPAGRTWAASGPDRAAAWLDRHAGALILARALAAADPGEALFRYRTAAGLTRTARFGLDGLAALLPRLERACGGPGR